MMVDCGSHHPAACNQEVLPDCSNRSSPFDNLLADVERDRLDGISRIHAGPGGKRTRIGDKKIFYIMTFAGGVDDGQGWSAPILQVPMICQPVLRTGP